MKSLPFWLKLVLVCLMCISIITIIVLLLGKL